MPKIAKNSQLPNLAKSDRCVLKSANNGLPIEIVSDRGTHFVNEVIKYLLDELMVIQRKSTPNHPQANGQAESSNKTLCTVVTKIVEASCID